MKPGDVVKLKSGGPPMTVLAVVTSGHPKDVVGPMLCGWFVGAAYECEPRRETYPASALEPVTKE